MCFKGRVWDAGTRDKINMDPTIAVVYPPQTKLRSDLEKPTVRRRSHHRPRYTHSGDLTFDSFRHGGG